MNGSQLESCLASIDQLYEMGKINEIEHAERCEEVMNDYEESQKKASADIAYRQTQAELERTQEITKFVYGSLR